MKKQIQELNLVDKLERFNQIKFGESNSSLCITSEILRGFLTALRNAVISDDAEVSLPTYNEKE